MLAACLSGQKDISVKQFRRPDVPENGVVVEMSHASICGSDVHIVYDGLHTPSLLGRPGYPGHEGVGIVAESRSDEFPVGTRVLTVPPGSAGGCFAEYQAVHESHLITVPDDVPLRNALMAQQLGTTVFALRKFITPSRAPEIRSAAIIGAGSAGLFFLQLLKSRGVSTVVSEKDRFRAELARTLEADRVVHTETESLLQVVEEETSGEGVDLVIEAAGYDSCRAEAVEIVRPRGVIGLFGYAERTGLSPFPIHQAFRKSLTIEYISGTQFEPGLVSFRHALDLIRKGEVRVDYCLEKSYSLSDLLAALEATRDQGHGAAKICVDIGAPMS